jgi:hypothetical protein
VGGPAGVADAEGAVEGRVGDDVFEVAELAGGAAQGEAFGATGYGDAGGVVATVFEAAQAFNDDGDDRLRTDISDNSTHRTSLDGGTGFCSVRAWDFWVMRIVLPGIGVVDCRTTLSMHVAGRRVARNSYVVDGAGVT